MTLIEFLLWVTAVALAVSAYYMVRTFLVLRDLTQYPWHDPE